MKRKQTVHEAAARRREIILEEVKHRGCCSCRYLRWKVRSKTRQAVEQQQILDAVKALQEQKEVVLMRGFDLSISESVHSTPVKGQRMVYAASPKWVGRLIERAHQILIP